MKSRIPLGEKEGPQLEFKSAAALENPAIIGRGIVAMLNAGGGEVWVGIREENERAVAVEAITNADWEVRRLWDHLVDRIEPPPLDEEVDIQQVPLSGEGQILCVVAKPNPSHKPYALLRKEGRLFVIRAGARVREMTWQELRERFTEHSPASGSLEEVALGHAEKRLSAAREKVQQGGGQRFWLGLEPVPDVKLDLQDRRYKDLLQDPRLSQNRPTGWNFALPYAYGPRLRQDRLLAEDEEGNGRTVEIWRNGAITFKGDLDLMFWKGEDRELWPFTLLEYPISAFRIAREIYRDNLRQDAKIVADLSFFHIRDWKLRPYSPGRWFLSNRISAFEDVDLVWEKPLIFSAEEIAREPDRCGYRLVERVYEAFGYGRDQIPQEFDPESGHLILPE